jgi:hypothetical protein
MVIAFLLQSNVILQYKMNLCFKFGVLCFENGIYSSGQILLDLKLKDKFSWIVFEKKKFQEPIQA